tara:strand:+ start:1609 stop:2406 length:798 start_codon:yes stop_codon:yes gene_type:complete
MNFLILGDIVGNPGKIALTRSLNNLITKNKIDFTIVNGENAAEDGKGITKNISKIFFDLGVNVITSGNHIWDKSETVDFISKENRLLRPANLAEGSPGSGIGIYQKNEKKITVINLMGNVFMRKTEDLFKFAENVKKKFLLKRNTDFLIIDLHAEITSEKMALGHFFDGHATCVVGTHTHVPTSDARILENGTAYQTDLGMCGDYNSVIGMDKKNSIMRFLKDKNSKPHFPSEGQATLTGVIVEADLKTGLAKNIKQVIHGGNLK